MNTVYWMKGLPGSGKSTIATEMLKDPEMQPIKRLSRDFMREMLDGGKWSKENEKVIIALETQIILNLLNDNYNVIVDDTNLSPSATKIMDEIKKHLPQAVHKTIDLTAVPVEECVRRDAKRANSVGAKVIRDMYRKHILCQAERKLDPLFYDISLPYCVIFDIDGTLAHRENRGPFEWDKVGQDSENLSISYLLDMAQHYADEYTDTKIFIFSGRDGSCRELTEKWLYGNNIHPDGLFMRAAGDMRPDHVVKKELFDQHIANKYNVLFVVDDRDQVVHMWRDMGITCLQCNYGDF